MDSAARGLVLAQSRILTLPLRDLAAQPFQFTLRVLERGWVGAARPGVDGTQPGVTAALEALVDPVVDSRSCGSWWYRPADDAVR